jgi:hypothetical protein
MPVPATIDDLSTTESSNFPAGTETPKSADNYLRAHASFIAQLRDEKTDISDLASTASGKGGFLVILQDGRSVQKFAENFHTLDRYGAVGDGVTDDSDAIEEALNYAPDVNLLRGVAGKTYRVTRTVDIVGNKTFGGDSAGSHGFQPMYIYHDPASTGELFNVTSPSSGVALMNFTVTGGNGAFCIVSSNSNVRFEYISMPTYNGSGIQLLSSGTGSSSSLIRCVRWVAPASATAYTGLEIDCNGGDVAVERFTGIRGAIGIDIKQGQTIQLVGASVNKQTRLSGSAWSSAAQFDTAGIRISGAGYKQAVSISEAYIEACDNGVYCDNAGSVESLTIEKSLFYDSGTAGVIGAWTPYGNSSINLGGANTKSTRIVGNHITALSNGDAGNPFYALILGDSTNTKLENNIIKTTGSYNSPLSIGASGSAFQLANTYQQSGSNPQPISDPGTNLVQLDPRLPAWLPITVFTNSWVAGSIAPAYNKKSDNFVVLRGFITSGTVGTAAFTLPVGYRPIAQCSFGVNSNSAAGIVTVATNGVVSINAGNNAFVYLNEITFEAA